MTNLPRKIFYIVQITLYFLVVSVFIISQFIPFRYDWSQANALLEFNLPYSYSLEFSKSILPDWTESGEDTSIEIYSFSSGIEDLQSFEVILELNTIDKNSNSKPTQNWWGNDPIFSLSNPGNFDYNKEDRRHFIKLVQISNKKISVQKMLPSHPEYENFSQDLFFVSYDTNQSLSPDTSPIQGILSTSRKEELRITNNYSVEDFSLSGSLF